MPKTRRSGADVCLESSQQLTNRSCGRRSRLTVAECRPRRRTTQTFVGLLTLTRKKEPSAYNTPPWRRSHVATSPDGSAIARMPEAREHSMSNPTVGTLQLPEGLELRRCNPAFIWADDSRYLAVPQWIRHFGLFLRQRLVIIDIHTHSLCVALHALAARTEKFCQRAPRSCNQQLAWNIVDETETTCNQRAQCTERLYPTSTAGHQTADEQIRL